MKGSLTFTNESSFIKPDERYSSRKYIAATLSIVLVALLHAIAAFTIAEMSLDAHKVRFDKYIDIIPAILGVALVVFLISYPVYVMTIVRPKRLVGYLKDGYRWHLFSKERVLFSYPVLIIVPIGNSIYSSFKTEIANLHPFWLDAPLYKLDRIIFLGYDPWQIIQRIIGDPNITRAIDFLYHPFWLILLVLTVSFHALGRHPLKNRLRFFLSYIIVWAVLGNLFATVLSSAGPCYFIQVTGQPSTYAELMGYLHSIKEHGSALNAVRLQEMLWNGHVQNVFEKGGGISAMPSIHIATTVLFALSMRNVSPIAEKLLYCYTFIIWIGSVHLAWHYATDGPVSVLCVIVIWYFTGKLTGTILPGGNEE